MINVLNTPNEFNFSRNDILFRIATNISLTTPGLVVGVQVYFQRNDSSSSAVVLELALTPDSNGVVLFNLKKVLDNHLEYELPKLLAVKAAKRQAGTFFIKVREVTFASTTAWATLTGAPVYKIIKGGLPNEAWISAPNSGFFYNYTNPHRLFMTWKKSAQLIGADERHYISYYHQDGDTTGANSGFTFLINYTDGTTDNTFSLLPVGSEFQQNNFYHFPVGVEALGLHLINPAKTILSFTVQPILSGAVGATAAYKFLVDYRQFYDKHTITYFSSLGGLETARVTGELEHEANRLTAVANVTRDTDTYGNEVAAMQKNVSNQENFIFRGNIGFEEDPIRQDVLRDLLMSRKHYEFKNDRWIPVLILNEQTSLGARSQTVFDFPTEWKYAITNENYAPEFEPIGSVVVPPGILPPGFTLPDAYSDYDYSYAYALSGSGDFTLTILAMPAWMTMSIIGSTLFVNGSPSAGDVATGVNVKFDITDNILATTITINDTIDVLAMPAVSIVYTTTFTTTKTRGYAIGPGLPPYTPVGVGIRFVYTAYGHEVTVVAVSGDTLTIIRDNMVAAINATTYSQWNDHGLAPTTGLPTAAPDSLMPGEFNVTTFISLTTLFQVFPY